MNIRSAAASARRTYPAFQKGQVWRIGDVNVAVTSVVRPSCTTTVPEAVKGIQTTLISKPNLRKILVSSKAVLIAE